MKTQVLTCRCGQQIRNIDQKLGYAKCEYCDSLVFIKKDEILSNDKAQNTRDLAIKRFKEKDIKGAVKYAEEVLQYIPDNPIGTFITSFYQCFMAEKKKKDALRNFFADNVAGNLIEEELKELLSLTRMALPHLMDCEDEVVKFALTTDDKATVTSFVEGYLPVAIGRRSGTIWLDDDLKDNYIRLASEFDTPKTMLALYKAMTDNDESPEREENHGMISAIKNFNEGFCSDIGDILYSISNPINREKFVKAYNAKKSAYEKIYQEEYDKRMKFKNSF